MGCLGGALKLALGRKTTKYMDLAGVLPKMLCADLYSFHCATLSTESPLHLPARSLMNVSRKELSSQALSQAAQNGTNTNNPPPFMQLLSSGKKMSECGPFLGILHNGGF